MKHAAVLPAAALLASLAVGAPIAHSQHAHETQPQNHSAETGEHEDDAGRGESSHDHHDAHHTLGIFIGDTSEDRLERNGGTLGIEYEYRFNRTFGVGVTAERVFGNFDTDVLVIPVAYHMGPWKAYAGPGLEFVDGEQETLIRVGLEYGFEAGDWEISPQVDLDFVSDERLFIFGVVFAKKF